MAIVTSFFVENETKPQVLEPETLGYAFVRMHDEVCRLSAVWSVFGQLFDGTAENVALWNRAGGGAAQDIHDSMVEKVLMHLARLTDKDTRTLSITYLIDNLEAQFDDEFRADLRDRLAKIKSSLESIKVHRDKRLAHLDRDSTLGDFTLPSINGSHVDQALVQIHELFQQLWLTHLGCEFGYDSIVTTGNGDQLLACLRLGLRFHELQNLARLGKISDAEMFRAVRDHR